MESRVNTTAIYLSDIEALQFVQFQKHYALIGLLESVKAFDIKSGSITIHFDKIGQIKGLEKHEVISI